jgi:hypothetical protein
VSQALAAALGYSLITALLFRNLLPVLTTDLYSDIGDPLLNCAVLAWNATHVPLTDGWWNFPSFAPLSGVTAFTEHLLGAYPVASPVIWTTGNPVLAYNVVLLLCFPLNGIATFALVRELTGSAIAAFVAGLAFAFAPFHAEHLSHVQTLMAFGMPLALFGLHRYPTSGKRADRRLARNAGRHGAPPRYFQRETVPLASIEYRSPPANADAATPRWTRRLRHPMTRRRRGGPPCLRVSVAFLRAERSSPASSVLQL